MDCCFVLYLALLFHTQPTILLLRHCVSTHILPAAITVAPEDSGDVAAQMPVVPLRPPISPVLPRPRPSPHNAFVLDTFWTIESELWFMQAEAAFR